jgi:hypothetical protein
MKLENAELGYSCIVPDRPTVRQQLEFVTTINSGRGNKVTNLERYWDGAKAIITDWQCPEMPDIEIDLGETTNPKQTKIVVDVGMKVIGHMNNLDNIDPNS